MYNLSNPTSWGLKKVGLWLSTHFSLVWWLWAPPSCREKEGVPNFNSPKWWFHKQNLFVNQNIYILLRIISNCCWEDMPLCLSGMTENFPHGFRFQLGDSVLLLLLSCMSHKTSHLSTLWILPPTPAIVLLCYPDSVCIDVCSLLLVLKIMQCFYIKVSTLIFKAESWTFFT